MNRFDNLTSTLNGSFCPQPEWVCPGTTSWPVLVSPTFHRQTPVLACVLLQLTVQEAEQAHGSQLVLLTVIFRVRFHPWE